MCFDVSADAYLRFMGQYSEPLAVQFADLAGVGHGQRVLDVGCGPGALTAELVRRTGADAVSAVEPSASFVAAVRERLPGVDVRRSAAEQLPFPADAFDAALAQLVVHFMTDPVQGLRELSRVTRPGGTVAACVWDHAGDRGPLAAFWSAVRELDPAADDESDLAGAGEGHLARLFAQAGLAHAQATTLTVRVRHASFEQWWERFTLGVGPAGAYVASLSPARQAELREQCRRLLPAGPVEISATAWAVTGQAPRLPASVSSRWLAMVFNGLVGVEVRVRVKAPANSDRGRHGHSPWPSLNRQAVAPTRIAQHARLEDCQNERRTHGSGHREVVQRRQGLRFHRPGRRHQ